jgi:HD superfamily phosphohydrolase
LEKNLKHTKIVNDPVHGFIEIPRGIILDLIDSPVFQRLRRIKQLGKSSLVYPGATHSRFNHALGAMHLMRQTLDVLRRKEVEISAREYEAALIAILLHDIGHGPFSHALEKVIIRGLHHEDMSLALMHYLDRQFDGKLSLAINIFEGKYPKNFLHQLVSSQLDMDRMDYLIRDSFFTGVVEGVVGIDRIIKTLNVYNNHLVGESKGIYSFEKFIVARRIMYWQVYLHKAAMSAELMMVKILERARMLSEAGGPLYLDENLRYFMETPVSPANLNEEVIQRFIRLDDTDIEFALKKWASSNDRVLTELCRRILNRQLIKTRIQDTPVTPEQEADYRREFARSWDCTEEEAAYFVFSGEVSNQAYLKDSQEPILIWFKNGEIKDLAAASDMQNISALSRPVVKYYLCLPEGLK